MINLAPSLKATGGARTGVNLVNLLDILDANGNLYYWSDRPVNAPPVITGSTGGYVITPPIDPGPGEYVAWAYPSIVSLFGADPQYVPGSAKMQIFEGGPLTEPSLADFDGFNMPELPPGAVVQKAVLSAFLSFNSSLPMGAEVSPLVVPFGPFDSRFSLDLGWGGSVTVTACTCHFEILYSLVPPGPDTFQNPMFASLTVSDLAIAIYYTLPGPTGGGGGGIGKPFSSFGPWIIQVPAISFHRSLQTDVGSFVVQNVSGDSLSRDVEKILRASTLEGAFAVYRLYQPDAEASWLEVHGTLSVQATSDDTMTLKFTQLLNPSQDDTPLEIYCETCQLQWAGPRCGSTESTECSYSFQTCQVVERIMIEANDYEKNFGEASANTALNVINRRRKI